MVQRISITKVHNWYVIPYWWNNKERKLNIWANIKIKNGKKLQLQALVDSRCTYMGIDKQLVKAEKIKIKPADISFKVFNVDGTKNGKVTWIVLLEVKINEYKEKIDAAVTDLNGMNMFLRHNWLVRHNSEVNWKEGTIWFTRCPRMCRTNHQNIMFKTKQIQTAKNKDNGQQKIGKEPNPMKPEDLLEYIQHFTHLFNKKKFERLLEQWEWDYKINLIEDVPKELNAKAYAMTIKEEKSLNQWLDEQLKAGLIMKSKSRYMASCFYIPKKDGLLWLVQDY